MLSNHPPLLGDSRERNNKEKYMKQIENIEVEYNVSNGELTIQSGTNIIKVPSDEVDNFIQSLIDEAW